MRLDVWHDMIQDAMWWEKDMHPDYAIILYHYTARAYQEGLRYYHKDPIGGDVDLTKIYEQCKLIDTLRAEYE